MHPGTNYGRGAARGGRQRQRGRTGKDHKPVLKDEKGKGSARVVRRREKDKQHRNKEWIEDQQPF